jgi:plastocyanin
MNPQTPNTTEASFRAKERIVWLWPTIIIAAVLVTVATIFVVRFLMARQVSAATNAQVSITSSGFNPATITVKRGESILWTNQDTKPHSVAADTSAGSNMTLDESLNPGDNLSTAFNQSGTYTYHDPAQPTALKGTVIVE